MSGVLRPRDVIAPNGPKLFYDDLTSLPRTITRWSLRLSDNTVVPQLDGFGYSVSSVKLSGASLFRILTASAV